MARGVLQGSVIFYLCVILLNHIAPVDRFRTIQSQLHIDATVIHAMLEYCLVVYGVGIN